MKRLFAGQIQIELGRRTGIDLPWRAHEQAAPRHVLDEPIDHEAIGPELSSRSDRDSNSCPLVHGVVKRTLNRTKEESNPFDLLTLGWSDLRARHCNLPSPAADCSAQMRAHSSVGR